MLTVNLSLFELYFNSVLLKDYLVSSAVNKRSPPDELEHKDSPLMEALALFSIRGFLAEKRKASPPSPSSPPVLPLM